MEITETLYVVDRSAWRSWLEANHNSAKEIWLIFPLKASGDLRIEYSAAVEEAICFGWIDSTIKKPDALHLAQRFLPRRAKSNWSELNKQRAKLMIEKGMMTASGLRALGNALEQEFVCGADIIEALQANAEAMSNFERFTEAYRRLRIGYVEDARGRPDEFRKRLSNLVRKCERNEMFGSQVGG